MLAGAARGKTGSKGGGGPVIQGSPRTCAKDRRRSLSFLSDGLVRSVTSLHFYEKGIKTAVRNYQWDILTNLAEPLNQIMFQNRPWIFQHYSELEHKAKTA